MGGNNHGSSKRVGRGDGVEAGGGAGDGGGSDSGGHRLGGGGGEKLVGYGRKDTRELAGNFNEVMI